MNEFKACLKKDYLDQKRTKKFLVYCLISVGLALFVFVTFAISSLVMNGEEMPTMLSKMFETNYENSISYFNGFMSVYFSLIIILMLKGTISKERKTQKWVLPIASGIDENKMIASKYITQILSVMISILVACLVHFVGTIIFFEKGAFGIGDLIANYGSLIIFMFFIFVCTIALDSIFNKQIVSALAPILFLMFSSSILESITIKGVKMLNYTPWLLADPNIFTNPSTFGVWEWIFGLSTYFGIIILLVSLSFKFGKNQKSK